MAAAPPALYSGAWRWPLRLALALGCALGCAPTAEGPVTRSDPLTPTATPVPYAPLELEVSVASFPHALRFEAGGELTAPMAVSCTLVADPEEVHEVAGATSAIRSISVYGLLASEDYDCRVTSGAASWSGGEATLASDLLPPQLTVSVDRGDSDGAYTLFNHWAPGADRDQVLLVDRAGRVRWSWGMSASVLPDVEARWLPDRQVFLIGGGSGLNPRFVDLDGVIGWTAPDLIGGWHHHDVSLLPDGDLALLGTSETTWGGWTFEGIQLQKLTPLVDAVTWSWQGQSALDAGELPPPVAAGVDPWHANALTLLDEAEGDAAYVSFKYLNKWMRVDRTTGAISWKLGVGGDFSLQDPSGAALPDEEWFWGQHDPEWNPATSRLLVYDNGEHRPVVGPPYSRVVEYEVDVPGRTATLVWSWREDDWYEPLYGDADRLPSGHVLVAMGHCNCRELFADHHSAIVEVDPVNGEVVWRLDLGAPGDGLYRAERLDGCAIFANQLYCPAN